VVVHYAQATSLGQLAPHDLRAPAPSSAARRVANSNRSAAPRSRLHPDHRALPGNGTEPDGRRQ
jgi:hypothetical protein